ncbi:uncharacterized protein LOC125548498 [Triticum urartu]|uniref:uncharacterized protein LOC125548498 n=1 Tax=Triticum urartu TaxID=4572 RepID=UPI0020444241|nr:uncharacterized protein LOC125548498 [Triticum urartu]XP_048568040.1 uncharacterized protein LOC125548498 [Triticum urartu]
MLKQYVPPSCSMNLFVKQYNKLQFDREQEEGFQEKRMRLSRAVLKVNTALEVHASKIHTRKMFEIFGGILYESGRYDVEEIIEKQKYIVTHQKAEHHEKWFKCHFEIPPRHILKRWSIHGRDNLPGHLNHYQQDMGPPDAPTFRHSAMYITALEAANMGDRNPAAFEFMMLGLFELRTRGTEVCAFNDGMGVVEQVSHNVVAGGPKLKLVDDKTTCSVRSVEGNHTQSRDATSVYVHPPMNLASEASCPNGDGYNSDFSEAASRLMPNAEQELLAPERNNKRGRPTTSSDKAPYEKDNAKRSRLCSICRGKGIKPALALIKVTSPKRKGRRPHAANAGFQGTEGLLAASLSSR